MNSQTRRRDDQSGEDVNADEVAAGLAPTPGYRYASSVGDQLFVAGQVPLDSDGDLIGRDDPATQARACLDNLRTLIGVHDFDLGDIRHLTIHVVGEHERLIEAWSAVTEWFGAPVPPATLLGAHLLGHGGQLVEIDATVRRHADLQRRIAGETGIDDHER